MFAMGKVRTKWGRFVITAMSGAGAVLLIASVVMAAADRQPMPSNGGDLYVEIPGVREFSGQMIVRPIQTDAELHAQAVADLADYSVLNYVWQTDEYIIAVPNGVTENDVSAHLMGTGNFQYAEPNWLVWPVACPNDPRLGNQWHHNANRMNSCAGWDLYTGDPSTSVGICDTGIRKTHEDLLLHRLEGYNAVDRKWESQGGRIDPVHPHGTWTTGCAAANGNNGKGVVGVGWNLSHRMLRVSNDSSGGSSLDVLQHAARTAVENGDKVASVSYSGVDSSSNLTTATYIKSIGGLLVWAAGNEGRRLSLSNRDSDDIIVAGGTDQNDNKAGFSNYGPMVDVTAPAVGVYTTDPGSDSSYGAVDGTSFACPLTAGLVALTWSRNPTLSPNDVEHVLKISCDDLGSSGVDDTYGYGRIDVFTTLGNGGSGTPVQKACCFPDGSCSDEFGQDCRDAGGDWHFDATCGTYNCPQPGACCVSDGQCEQLLEADCIAGGGTFHGENSSCSGQCPCDKVKKFVASCGASRNIKMKVVFKDHSFDGTTIRVAVDAQEFTISVVNRRAIFNAGPFSGGSHTCSLASPNCGISQVVSCL